MKAFILCCALVLCVAAAQTATSQQLPATNQTTSGTLSPQPATNQTTTSILTSPQLTQPATNQTITSQPAMVSPQLTQPATNQTTTSQLTQPAMISPQATQQQALSSQEKGTNETCSPLQGVANLDINSLSGVWYGIGKSSQKSRRYNISCAVSNNTVVQTPRGPALRFAMYFRNDSKDVVRHGYVHQDPSNPAAFTYTRNEVKPGKPNQMTYSVLVQQPGYALWGDSCRKRLLVASRTPTLDENIVRQLLDFAKSKHSFQSPEQHWTAVPQSGCWGQAGLDVGRLPTERKACEVLAVSLRGKGQNATQMA